MPERSAKPAKGRKPGNEIARAERNAHIADMALSGLSQSQIAARTGLHHTTISRVLSDAQVKDTLDSTYRYYVSLAPIVQSVFTSLIQSDDPKISADAVKHWHAITGMAPSHSQSIVVQQIFNGQAIIASPEVLGILRAAVAPRIACDVEVDDPD